VVVVLVVAACGLAVAAWRSRSALPAVVASVALGAAAAGDADVRLAALALVAVGGGLLVVGRAAWRLLDDERT
jgi:hypothetical protein